jgi:hypothetical protein
MELKIITGGQTGIDRIALEEARALGIKTGGTAPKQFKTESGNDSTLEEFGLVQSSSYMYDVRTSANVLECEGVAIYGNVLTKGSRLTKQLAIDYGRPIILNPEANQLLEFCKLNSIEILMIAGNRASYLRERADWYRMKIKEGLTLLKQNLTNE